MYDDQCLHTSIFLWVYFEEKNTGIMVYKTSENDEIAASLF